MDIKELVLSLSDPHSENIKAWTGGLGQLERLLENTCGRSSESTTSDMFPGFPGSSSSQAMPSPAPLNPGQPPNPWFHQSPFSMGSDIHAGSASTPVSGSPYWLPHHQYPPASGTGDQSRYQGRGSDLYSASSAATATTPSPWWFGHGASATSSGLHSPQYFQPHVTTTSMSRNEHSPSPFHASPPPSSAQSQKSGYLQHGLATPQLLQQPLHSPATSQHRGISPPAPSQTTPVSQHQPMGSVSQPHQRSLMSPTSQQLGSPPSLLSQQQQSGMGGQGLSQQQHHQSQRPMARRAQHHQAAYSGMSQHPSGNGQRHHQMSQLPTMTSSPSGSQMMPQQSQLLTSASSCSSGQPAFQHFGQEQQQQHHQQLSQQQHQQTRYDMQQQVPLNNAMAQQPSLPSFGQQTTGQWGPGERNQEPPSSKRPKQEVESELGSAPEKPASEHEPAPTGSSTEGTPKKSKGKRKKEESKRKKEILLEQKKGFQRKNIRDIKNDTELDEVTLNAQKEEQERMKRLQEARMRALQMQTQASSGPLAPGSHLGGPISLGSSSSSSSDEDDEDDDDSASSQSSSDDESGVIRAPGDVIDISSDEGKLPEEDDDDVVMVVSDDADDEKADDLNDGSHVNDSLNQPDSMGRVLVNVGHPPEDPDVFMAPQLAPIVKPHQIGGIRFLFDNVVESVGRFDTSSGFGCILAHSMGLGKTLQVVSFVDVLLRHTAARKVLCITPINTIQNWLAEFDKWVPAPEALPPGLAEQGHVRPRSYHVYLLNDMYRSTPARAELILDWHSKGGVLLMGYEMYRMLALKKVARPNRRRRSPKKEDMSLPEDNTRHSQLLEDVFQALVNPGPDLVICDEGHRIKNCNASTSTALKSIRTKRRIVLTGYPLQNNLLEYWCMVDFVRPSYLGTRSEFCNMFERPIQNGQCLDSTPKDRQLMRFRAHVLHSLLQGFVQRRGHAVLRDALPKKEEHVLLIRMTPIQRTLYREFVKEFLHNYRVTNPLKFFAVCCKVWNHPDILFNLVQDKKSMGALDIDLDIDLLGPPTGKDSLPSRKSSRTGSAGIQDSVVAENHNMGTPDSSNMGSCLDGPNVPDSPYSFVSPSESGVSSSLNLGASSKLPTPKYIQEPGFGSFREKSENNISYEWAYPLLEKYVPDLLENSHKFLVLMTILEQTLGVGDKLLVFSQSLSTLDLIERFLGRREVPLRPGLPHGDKWTRGRNYFRLDGSTSAQEREKLINEYNANPCVSLFLLSTRAGCLGINLTGANRIVVLDASWNPCHDAQAVCRIYRYGQAKPCHIYRLVCDNCLEKRIYDRQVNKQGMSDRVVDEMNPEANLTWKDVSTLVQDNEDDPPVQDLSTSAGGYTDSVLRTLSMEYSQCLTKEPFEHESLLLDRKDLKLTKFEKRLAKQSYELEKRATLHGGRTYMHAAACTNGYQTWQNRQGTMTFVGPTPAATTPSPMQPGGQNGDMPVWGTPNVMQSLLRQGMTVQRMRVPAKVTIPLNNSADPPVEIPPGTEILVMKTPKGVYLRIPDGRIIAVRIPVNVPAGGDLTAAAGQSNEGTSGGVAAIAGNKQSFGIVQPSLQCGGRVQLSGPGAAVARQGNKGPPEVINLDDDSDLPDESSDDDDDDNSLTKNGGIISSTTDAKTPSPAVPMATTNKEGGEAVAV